MAVSQPVSNPVQLSYLCNMVNTHTCVASLCALKMAIHARVPGRVLGRANSVGYTDLCHTAKTHARV
ncbi:hypothetical protein F383_32320 [Gossypium arboreum]|uniref:Uncharacterized protein n=1 Tax=Gossypium arboreum TaxID=29729 RepID=A0A0B0PMQ9_GOSAR|nr:hypothetical protein F383_32320 [Gossypium arboreum]